MSKCIVCKKLFVEGELLQAFLRCPEDSDGSWTAPIKVDAEYQERAARNKDKIKRKHSDCEATLKGKYDGCDSPLAEQNKSSCDQELLKKVLTFSKTKQFHICPVTDKRFETYPSLAECYDYQKKLILENS